ncbi:CEP57 protein, partial [Peucedramus taeniatus]|nr:CEP57 protein [Peucedramus taeniatus]
LQTGLETNRLLIQAASPLLSPKARQPRKKTKQPEKKCSVRHPTVQPHYRLCLGDVPFVAGKSTSPSHSVTANVQHVLHLMKHHTKALCNRRVVNDTPAKPTPTSRPASKSRRPSLPIDLSSSQEELSEVLLTLQDEFGQMS